MADRFPLVLNSLGMTEELQAGDSVWSALLSSSIDDGTALSFGQRTTLHSDELSGLVLETSSAGDLFIIRNDEDTISYRFGADGSFQLPATITPPEPADGAFWFDGTDLYLGGPE